jgi:TRAP-type transport system periplasmic protein
MIVRRIALGTLSAILMLGGVTGAQAVTELRIGWTSADTEVDPYATTAREFAAALEELSPGTFNVQFFPSRQLGDEREMLENISLGAQDAGVITGTAVATMESAFQLNDLPFLYQNAAQAHALLDGPVGDRMMESLSARGIVGLGFGEGGFRHTINNVRPIRVPEDFEGMRFRVQPSDLFVDAFAALGASPTPMAWGEVFTAVQQGTVDGLEIPLTVMASNNYDEVTRYLSLTGHAYNALALLVSQRFMDRLSDEEQEVVRQAAAQAIERQREKNAQNESGTLDTLVERGMEMNEVDDPAAFQDKLVPVYDRYRDAIGADLVDQALSELGRN